MQGRKRRSRFTLIELLVVVGIMIIVMGLVGPSFYKIARGSAVDAAARMVSSQLMLVRSEAISKRRHIALLMPGKEFTGTKNGNIYYYSSFRPAWVDYSESGSTVTCTFNSWVEGTEWTFLPMGAIIALVDGTNEQPFFLEKASSGDDMEKGKYWIRFTSSGTPSYNEGKWFVKGRENKDDGDLCPAVSKDGAMRAVIFKPNGQCLSTTSVTVMEAIASAGSADLERVNEVNIRVIQVRGLTGQIKYLY